MCYSSETRQWVKVYLCTGQRTAIPVVFHGRREMKAPDAYQIKVTLSDSPAIWRRLQIPGDFTFSDLHVAIQDAMGWHDWHLHEFEILNPLTR